MRKKAPTPKRKAPTPDIKDSGRMVSTTDMLLSLAVAQASTPRLWPCLVGPTGCGKTARVRQLAETLKLPLVSPPLTQGLPEDFSGLPRVTASGYSWHLPPWALKAMAEKCVVFFDEIDKASEDHQKILLPVLHELEIHGRSLHPGTIMVCAMQAPTEAWRNTETGQALMARIVPLTVASESAYLTHKYNIDLSGLTWADYPVNLDRSPTMRGLDWLFTYMGREYRSAYHYTAATALFGETIGTMLVDRHNNRVLTAANLCKLIRSEPATIARLSVAELVALGTDAIFILDCKSYEEVQVKILTEGTEEDHIQFTTAQFNEKERRQGPEQSPIEIFPGCEEPEVVAMINTIATRVGEVWKARA